MGYAISVLHPIAIGPAAAGAGKSIYCNTNFGSNTCLITGLNATAISSGIIATITLGIAPSISATASTVALTGAIGATPDANAIGPLDTAPGNVTITPLPVPSAILSPAPGGTLSGSMAAFTWDGAVLIFGLSPLATFYHRMVLLDNMAVADGYWIMLTPLPPGSHVIRFTVSLDNPFFGHYEADVTHHLQVR